METRQVVLADAFADEPLGGLPVAVVPEGEALSAGLLRRIATEFGAAGAVTLQDGAMTYVARKRSGGSDGADGAIAGAVAGGTALMERGHVEAGAHSMAISGTPGDGSAAAELGVEIEQDRRVGVSLPGQQGETTAATADLAAALGIDVASLDDVSADLPAARIGGYGGTLLVPVNFLEHLSRADPAADDLAALLAAVEATRLCAFTFDTLGTETDLHARFFRPAVDGCERPASGIAAGACGAHLSRHAVFDDDRESVRIECGRFLDRPGTIVTTLDEQPRVGGNALTVLEGDLTLPPEDDGDGIIEV